MTEQEKAISRDIYFIKAELEGAVSYIAEIEKLFDYSEGESMRAYYEALGVNLGQICARYSALGSKIEVEA